MPENPKNTVYAAKRLIGRKFQDPAVQLDLKHLKWAPVIDEGEGGSIVFKGVCSSVPTANHPYQMRGCRCRALCQPCVALRCVAYRCTPCCCCYCVNPYFLPVAKRAAWQQISVGLWNGS